MRSFWTYSDCAQELVVLAWHVVLAPRAAVVVGQHDVILHRAEVVHLRSSARPVRRARGGRGVPEKRTFTERDSDVWFYFEHDNARRL